MARYDIGPYYVRLAYFQAGRQHVHMFSVRPVAVPAVGEPFDVYTKDGQEISLSAGIAEYVNVLKALVHEAGTISRWDCFFKDTPTSDPMWVNGGEIVGAAGTWAGTVTIASQLTITYRTSLGHRWKLQLMESPVTPDQVFAGTGITGDPKFGPLNTYLTGDSSIVRARDGGTIVSALRGVTKVNDALRRRYKI